MDKIPFAWFALTVLVICDRFSAIVGQGNRGVIVNNQKLNHSSEVDSVPPPLGSKLFASSLPPIAIQTTTKTRRNSREPSKIHIYGAVPDVKPSSTTSGPSTTTQGPSTTTQKPSTTTQRPSESPPAIMSPSRLPDLSGIASILNRNQSDFAKIDEIVQKLNVSGGVTQINLINVNSNNRTKVRRKATFVAPITAPTRRKNATYVQPYAEHGGAKDSKELKVQFVLDCDLKESLNRDGATSSPATRFPSPSFDYYPPVTQRPYYRPDAASAIRRTTQLPTYIYPYKPRPLPVTAQPHPVTARPLQPPVTETPTTRRTRVKNVYVDPPGVAFVAQAMEGAYDFLENALTEPARRPVYESHRNAAKKRNRRRRPIVKRSTVRVDKIYGPTQAPEYRNTRPAYASNEKQKLTTQIHVTSEFVGKDPVVVSSDQSSSQYVDSGDIAGDDDDDDDDDDYDDDDDDYSDEMSFDAFDDYSGSEEDYDESESSEESVESANPIKRKADVDRKSTRKKRPASASYESDEYEYRDDGGEEYDDDDDNNEGGMDFSMPDVGEFFANVGNVFSPMASYVPSFLFFGGKSNRDDDIVRRTKHKKSPKWYEVDGSYLNHIGETQEKTSPWYGNFFYGSTEEGGGTMTTTPASSSDSDSFFDWLSGSSDESTESTPAMESSSHDWFSGLFGGETTTKAPPNSTTTESPLSVSGLPNPHQWLSMLASHIATTPAKPLPVKIETPKRVNYDNYQVWRLNPSTQAHVEYLREYKTSYEGEKIQWLKGPAMRGPTDILIPPSVNKEVEETLDYESIPYDVVIWNLEQAIKYENPVLSRRQKVELEATQGHPMTWYRYHGYEDITFFVDYLQRTYPNIVDLIHIGRSFEGRPLVVVKISFDDADDFPPQKTKASMKSRKKKKISKPGVFIEGGVHGREWITPAVTTWLLKELVKHNSSLEDGSHEREIVRSVDWYILPVSNPDGYEYSLNYDRMWRKTRSKHPDKASMLALAMGWLKQGNKNDTPTCYGTDPNRNYDVKWGETGSSTSPCNEFYAGPKVFSEPETKALSTFLLDYQKSLNVFLSLHSYGQLISYPSTANSTFSSTQRANDLRDMAEVAVNSLRDLTASGRYSIDHSHEMSDPHSGTSTDYAMHEAGIKYSFTIELRDTGTQGFLLSPSYIDTTAAEVFEMVKAMADYTG